MNKENLIYKEKAFPHIISGRFSNYQLQFKNITKESVWGIIYYNGTRIQTFEDSNGEIILQSTPTSQDQVGVLKLHVNYTDGKLRLEWNNPPKEKTYCEISYEHNNV